MNGSIFWQGNGSGGWERRVGTEEEMSTDAAAGLGFGAVGGIGMNFEAHATCMVPNFGIGVGRGVVQQVGDGFGGGFGGAGGGNGAKGDQHGGVNGSGVV